MNWILTKPRPGLLTTGIFLSHAALQVPGGHLANRLESQVLIAPMAVVAAGNVAIGFSAAYWQLLFWKLFVGIGTGTWPYAALFARAAALVPERAGAAMGLVNMLGILMILVGAPLAGRLPDWSGSFRSSFIAMGAFTLLACMAVFFLRNEPSPVV